MPDFEYLLESTDPLNIEESINACVFALQRGRNELVRQWLGEPGKLACTEEMGDAVKPYDSELALAIYVRSQAAHKVIKCYAESGQFDKIVHQSQTIGYVEDDYLYLLESILNSETTEQSVKLATILSSIKDKHDNLVVNVQAIVDIFVKANLNAACIDFLMEMLKSNTKTEGALQTQLFELYFAHDTTAAKLLLDSKRFTYYDRKRIAQLCEKYGYLRSAIEMYQSMADIRRVFASQEMAKFLESESDWVRKYLGSLKISDAIQCLESLLTINSGIDRNNRIVVAKLAAELYRKQFSKREVVDALHNALDLDREILQFCENSGWNGERIQFLLRLKNPHLWSSVLTSGISTQKDFISEVTSFALGPDPDQDAISCLIKALTTASLSSDLLALLEALLLESNYDNRSLRNLLLFTAIKLANVSDNRSRVVDYAMRLENYDGADVAVMAESHELFEEAFAIFRKFGDKKAAMRILLEKICDLDRARKFAEECNDPTIWALLPPERQESPRVEEIVEEKEPTPVIAASIELEEGGEGPHPVDTLILPTEVEEATAFREEVLLSEMTIKTPLVEIMKPKKKLPPIVQPKVMNSSKATSSTSSSKTSMTRATMELAEFASKVQIKQNARRVLQMTNEDVKRWLGEIGLGNYCDRFSRYNGQMLDNLYSLHFSAPEFFCQSVSNKLDFELDNLIIFFGGLCRLYGDQR